MNGALASTCTWQLRSMQPDGGHLTATVMFGTPTAELRTALKTPAHELGPV